MWVGGLMMGKAGRKERFYGKVGSPAPPAACYDGKAATRSAANKGSNISRGQIAFLIFTRSVQVFGHLVRATSVSRDQKPPEE